MSKNISQNDLALRVGELSDFSAGMMALAELVPERTTLAQMVFFMLAGTAHAAGKPATFTEIKEAAGDTINRSLHTTYQLFLDRPLRRSDYDSNRKGLGWLTRVMDPKDNRRNYLHLTPTGRKVMAELLGTIHRKDRN